MYKKKCSHYSESTVHKLPQKQTQHGHISNDRKSLKELSWGNTINILLHISLLVLLVKNFLALQSVWHLHLTTLSGALVWVIDNIRISTNFSSLVSLKAHLSIKTTITNKPNEIE